MIQCRAIEKLRTIDMRLHVAQNDSHRCSAITGETIPHPSYPTACVRKRIKDIIGWIKTLAGTRKTKLRGLATVDWAFPTAAYDLVWVPKLVGTVTRPGRPVGLGPRLRRTLADRGDRPMRRSDLLKSLDLTFNGTDGGNS
jgi:hypothetical protein